MTPALRAAALALLLPLLAPLAACGPQEEPQGAPPPGGATVTFGGAAATVTAGSATGIPALTPPGAPGAVTDFDGQIGVAPGLFVAPGP